jgi:hypothetical protein
MYAIFSWTLYFLHLYFQLNLTLLVHLATSNLSELFFVIVNFFPISPKICHPIFCFCKIIWPKLDFNRTFGEFAYTIIFSFNPNATLQLH